MAVSRRPRRPWPIARFVALAGVVAFATWQLCAEVARARRAPGPDAQRIEFDVEGLDCPVWCSVRLSDAIDGLDGARVTAIDREHGRVVVAHDPTRQTVRDLQTLMGRHGFPVTAVHETAADTAAGPR